ncbi:endonuclease domain-containing protein [Acinetobacter junii]|uniref:Endonuclease domain-containing protein n=1 Tax=Acinetobacter junii TaxID=40215 RepID=A0AAW5RGG6_ACIJU|nr:endonuclease domain-containing protein [Acinetobacter junii]MCU4398515.1 endonuclease domain-containing protein [Acinetobacter junii]
MEVDQYLQLTRKCQPKTKPRNKPLPKANEKYLEAFDDIERALQILDIKYQKLFQFEPTKHWRFDFYLIEYRILVEIAGGPWSAGRKRKRFSYDADREDTANELGYRIVRIESASRFKINESGPMQIRAHFASQWIKNLKRHTFNGPDQTLPPNGLT